MTFPANRKRTLEFEDLRKVVYLSAPALSPDGKTAVFVKQMADPETGGFIPHIYEVGTQDGEIKQLATAENSTEDVPAYSPDGGRLAYLCTRSDEKQVWVLDLGSGETRQLTTLRHGVKRFAWAPDCSRLAFEAAVWPDEVEAGSAFTEMTPQEKSAWLDRRENSPTVVEELMYKFDETHGVVDGSVSQIGVVDTETGKAVMLTNGTKPYSWPSWSADSARLAFFGCPYRHHKATISEVFVCDADGSNLTQVTKDEEIAGDTPVVFTPDGSAVIYSASRKDETESYVLSLFKRSLSGGEAVDLLPAEGEELCHGVYGLPTGRTVYGVETPNFQLSRSEDAVYFISAWHGRERLYRLPLDGPGKLEPVIEGEFSVHSFCPPVDGRLVYTRGDPLTLAEFHSFDCETGSSSRLTWSNHWLDECELAIPQEMWVDSADGKARVHGWVLPPVGLEEGQKVPAVLDIHGGPPCCYVSDFWFEFQMLAARGLAAVYCNPRGSTGYGKAYAADDLAWGQEACDDLMAFLDAAIQKGFIDGERVGVTGGSYGGWMTNKIITTTQRFKAAVTQRTLSNLATSYGTGDMGFISSQKDPPPFLDYMLNRVKRSPIRKIDQIKTPLLILHGRDDYRCTFEQAEQLFIAMKDRNPEVPVRMVVFPGENHELTRSGRVHAQIRHLQEMVEWFSKHLGAEKAQP